MEWEQKTLMSELTQGKELAMQLKNHLGCGVPATSSVETRENLVKKLLSSYEKALSLLNWDDGNNNVHKESVAQTLLCGKQQHKLKRRKTLSGPSWTEQVRFWSEPSRYGSNNDGYSWRKYGQKEIIGATFPRGYYRCAHHTTQGCNATKQVQRSDEDPTMLNVRYCGRHTCVQFSCSHVTTSSVMDQHQQDNPESTSKEILDQNLDTTEHEFQSQALPSPLITPEYVEENIFGDLGFEYFPISSRQINNGQFLESDPVNLVSPFLPVSYSSFEDIHLLNHNVDFGENYQFMDPFEPLV